MTFINGSYEQGFPFINKVFKMNGKSYLILNIIYCSKGIYGFDVIEQVRGATPLEIKYEDVVDFL